MIAMAIQPYSIWKNQMMAQPEVEGLVRRTRQYELNDGLRDLQLSLMLGLGGGMIWLALSPRWVGLLQELVRRYG